MANQTVKEKTVEFLKMYPQSDFPVDIIHVANKLGLTVMEHRFNEDDIYGALITKNTQKVILVNPDISKEKQLFTIAHEIGHHFLHEKDKDLYYKNNSLREDKLEKEADDFAADILMPENIVRSLYHLMHSYDLPLKENVIMENFMKYFGVTKKVVEYRLKRLELK